MPFYLGEPDTEQFTVTTRVQDVVIGKQKIHDPFTHTFVKLRGFRHAWDALARGIKVEVSVHGSEGAQRAIMTLDPYALNVDTEDILESRRISRESSQFSGCMKVGS